MPTVKAAPSIAEANWGGQTHAGGRTTGVPECADGSQQKAWRCTARLRRCHRRATTRGLQRHLLHDLQAVAVEAHDLAGAVGEQADPAQARARAGSGRRCRSRAGSSARSARRARHSAAAAALRRRWPAPCTAPRPARPGRSPRAQPASAWPPPMPLARNTSLSRFSLCTRTRVGSGPSDPIVSARCCRLVERAAEDVQVEFAELGRKRLGADEFDQLVALDRGIR